MNTNTILVTLGAFLASAVETVEALTIVLGGRGRARLALALTGAAPRRSCSRRSSPCSGPALDSIPIDALRLVVGALLLASGCSGCGRRSCARAGYKALHDEDEAFRERARAGRRRCRHGEAGPRLVRVHRRVQGRAAGGPRGGVHRDRVRSHPGQLGLAIARRRRGVVLVVAAGLVARRRWRGCRRTRSSSPSACCSRASACFWGAEGAGVDWPGDETPPCSP